MCCAKATIQPIIKAVWFAKIYKKDISLPYGKSKEQPIHQLVCVQSETVQLSRTYASITRTESSRLTASQIYWATQK